MDRNFYCSGHICFSGLSLSARRAWIEMSAVDTELLILLVALRKESVDRNLFALAVWPGLLASLSARRAWIEISL